MKKPVIHSILSLTGNTAGISRLKQYYSLYKHDELISKNLCKFHYNLDFSTILWYNYLCVIRKEIQTGGGLLVHRKIL